MNRTDLEAIVKQIESILEARESTGISPALELALNNLFFQEENELGDREQIDNIIAIIEYIQSRIKGRKQKAKALFQLIEIDSNTMRYLEHYLIKQLRDRQIDHLETGKYDLEVVQDTSQRELVVNEGVSIRDVPEEYQKFFLEIDDYSVRKALESGEELDFASLKEPEYKLRIGDKT